MQLRVLAFAQAADQLGFRERVVDCAAADSARTVMARIATAVSCESLRVAVDCEYRGWDEPLGTARELALIPPVSGG